MDGLDSPDEVLAFIAEMKAGKKAQSPSYGKSKEELYREGVRDLEESPKVITVEAKKVSRKKLRDEDSR